MLLLKRVIASSTFPLSFERLLEDARILFLSHNKIYIWKSRSTVTGSITQHVPETVIQLPEWVTCFLRSIQTGSGVHSASCSPVTMGSYSAVRRLVREGDHWPPTRGKVKSAWSNASSLPYFFMDVKVAFLQFKRQNSNVHFKETTWKWGQEILPKCW
jgi:hypothetical protein